MVIGMFTSNNKKELLAPYFEEIAKQTLDAAKDHDKVVLSHATYQQVPRDIVIETIVKGGEIYGYTLLCICAYNMSQNYYM